MARSFYILLLCGLLTISCNSQNRGTKKPQVTDSSVYPRAVGYVNDFDSVFTAEGNSVLYDLVNRHKQKTSIEIAIATIRNFPGDISIDSFATNLFNKWGIGTKEKNNGVLILLCRPCRKVVIRSGLGMEKILSDREIKKIIDERMVPYFKEDAYYEGVVNGLETIIKKTE